MTDCKGNELNIRDEVVYVYGKNSYARLETGKITKFYKNHFGEDECSVDGNTHILGMRIMKLNQLVRNRKEGDRLQILDDKAYCIQEMFNVDPFDNRIAIIYPKEFYGDLVLEENIPKMLSVIREYIKECESYLMFKNMIGNARWDSEKLKYGNIAYEHQEKADKLAEKMNEGISPYAWYVNKVNNKLVFNGIVRKVDYTVCLEKIQR